MKVSKLAFLPVFLLMMLLFALPAFAIDYTGDKTHDLGAPDPENYPYFIRQIPVAIFESTDLYVEDGSFRLSDVAWAWGDAYTNDELGTVSDTRRMGLTITYVKKSSLPESAFANTTTKPVWIPMRTVPSFDSFTVLPEYYKMILFHNVTRSQVKGSWMPTDPVVLVNADIPDKETMLAAAGGRAVLSGAPASVWDKLAETYVEYENEFGEKYVRLGNRKPGVTKDTASLYHRLNYMVQLNDGTVKHITDLNISDMDKIKTSLPIDLAGEAANAQPYWDTYENKPDEGFYRAAQTWHPLLDPPNVPGAIASVDLGEPVDLVLEAPEEVTGQVGETVNVKVKVKNNGDKLVNTTLGYRLDGSDWHPYSAWSIGSQPQMIEMGAWSEKTIDIPVKVTGSTQEMRITVNYGGKNPPVEMSFENNTAFTLIKPKLTNLKVTDFKISPNPVLKNKVVAVSAKLVNEGADAVTTVVRGLFNGDIIDEINVDISENGSKEYSFEITAPDTEGSYPVGIVANPYRDAPENETTFNDNYAGDSLKVIDDAVDLSAMITYYSDIYFSGETETVGGEVTNHGNKPVTTTAVWRFDGKQISNKSLTIPAKSTVQYNCNFTMPKNAKTGSMHKLEIEVNPNRNQPPKETIWANNKDSISIEAFKDESVTSGELGDIIIIE